MRQALDVCDGDFTKCVHNVVDHESDPWLALMMGSVMMCTRKRLVLTVKVIPWFVPMMGVSQ